MRKKITFIINPISGGIPKKNIPDLIKRILNQDLFEVEILFTESEEHNLMLARNAVALHRDVIVAVGGDGTINHVAKCVAGTDLTFGIVPMGSGNGLARHLHIPASPAKAIGLLNTATAMKMDTGMANETFFLNVAGAGFDAHVSWKFATAPRRGFWSYTTITLNEFARYQPENYELLIDGNSYTRDAFLLCVANGSQYGNNAFIAPLASVTDGKFEISVMKPFRIHQMPGIGAKMFLKNLTTSRHMDMMRGTEVVIRRKNEGVFNIDGEPVRMKKDINLHINPASLNILTPGNHEQ